ncbi:hypothetical protein [uncultured Corynebacterium sp.]|uniref:hypothetical protein n=1 Tax=uncultured Corynebacterium sp. TaxID=159447 RepID=UPI0025F57776|nr:hypothetical protein [uncultured Corynebacterium sp.]
MSDPAGKDATGNGATGESLLVHDVAALTNLGVLARKAVALDAQALMRVRSVEPGSADDPVAASRPAGIARVWATTPFGPMACRTMAVTPGRDDMVVRADAVSAATGDARSVPQLDAAVPATLDCGNGADASWPGSLPTDGGWTVVDVVPATVLRDLEAQAREVAKEESGPLGPPTSLLDQKVLTVRDRGDGASAAEISMREVFALCAMGFVPAEPGEDEPVRVSVKGRWRRMDGRFGSVYASEGLGVLPL